jgi:hypothetical protein
MFKCHYSRKIPLRILKSDFSGKAFKINEFFAAGKRVGSQDPQSCGKPQQLGRRILLQFCSFSPHSKEANLFSRDIRE